MERKMIVNRRLAELDFVYLNALLRVQYQILSIPNNKIFGLSGSQTNAFFIITLSERKR